MRGVECDPGCESTEAEHIEPPHAWNVADLTTFSISTLPSSMLAMSDSGCRILDFFPFQGRKRPYPVSSRLGRLFFVASSRQNRSPLIAWLPTIRYRARPTESYPEDQGPRRGQAPNLPPAAPLPQRPAWIGTKS